MTLENKIKFIQEVESEKVYRRIDQKPFDSDLAMINVTYDLIKDVRDYDNDEIGIAKSSYEKSKRIHKWVNRGIRYENPMEIHISEAVTKFGYRGKTASETFRMRKGLCTDISFLYTTMSRIAGLESGIAIVSLEGGEYNHMCSWVEWFNKKHLVDSTREEGFVNYKKFRILNDNDARHFHDNYTKNLNSRNWGEWNDYCSNSIKRLGVGVNRVNERENKFVNFFLAASLAFGLVLYNKYDSADELKKDCLKLKAEISNYFED